MGDANPDWIDTPEFHWNPERPFRGEPPPPRFVETTEPRFAEPKFADPPFAPANDDATVEPPPSSAPTAARVRRITIPEYLKVRLIIGLAQGIGLMFLFAAPHSLSSPLGLVLLFAPLLMLAGLGTVPGKLLLPWTVIAGVALFLLGTRQNPDATNGTLILAAGLFLFIGQGLIAAWGKSGTLLASYAAYRDSGWTLGLHMLLCALAALACVALLNEGFALLRDTAFAARPIFAVALFTPVCVAVMSWFASRLRRLQPVTLTGLTWALPFIVLLAAATGVAGFLLQWQPPLLVCVVQAFLLLLCINASYGDGSPRPRWRQILEAAGAFALAPLVLLGAAELGPEVAQGWSNARILAGGTLGLLGLYAFFYIASALISLGGGAWMKRLERANLGLAMVALGLLATLACR